MLSSRALEKERAARLEAERISHLKDEFLATLGAELRAPLNAVLGWARLIESGRLAPDELVRGGRTIARNAQALAQLVDDVVDLGKMVSDKMRLDAEETDLREIVEAAIDSIHDIALAKGVTVVRELEPAACLIFGDPQRLQRMVMNLLSNAVKFTPRGGRIGVDLTRGRSDCMLRVTDSGIGMSPELVPLVFERFTRDDVVTGGRPHGLGLGLAIARRTAELHGGAITATSEGKGSGATFTVTLPRLAPRVTEGSQDETAAMTTQSRLESGVESLARREPSTDAP
jgi:signal transduction histidine kinase